MHYLFLPLQPAPHADNGGCAMLPPGWIHPGRKLDSSVMIAGRKGTVVIEEEGELLEVKPNRIILLTAGRFHRGVKPIESQASYYWFHFTLPNPPQLFSDDDVAPILGNPLVTQQRLADAVLFPQQLDPAEGDPIVLLFRELLNEQERPCYTRWRFQLLFQNLLIAITAETIRTYQPPRTLSASSSLVYAVVAAINSDLIDPNLSVKLIAANLNHHPDYIGRQFRLMMGMSVGEYILQQRIKLAEQLLQETHEPINRIALQTGFATVRHFLRQFHKERGMTPSELRRRYQAMHFNIR